MGKGADLRTGFKLATEDIFIVQNSAAKYSPKEIPLFKNLIPKDKADVFFESVFFNSRSYRLVYLWHSVFNDVLNLFIDFSKDLNLTDLEFGYKAFRTEIIKSIKMNENKFGFKPEITTKTSKMNLRIYLVGVSYYGRTYAEGKKIEWRNGLRSINSIIKYNLFR